MKRIFRLMLILACCHGWADIAMAAGDAGATEMLRQEIELTVAALEMQRKAVITANMNLSDREQAFWPVYNDYRQAMQAVINRRIEIIGAYIDAYQQDQLDEGQARQLLDRYLRVLEERIRVKKRFRSRFMRVLPAAKAVRFYQLDNRFDLLVNMELSRGIPLAGES